MLILGVDPGSRFTGYGLIAAEGPAEDVLAYGVIRLNDIDSHPERLKQIYGGIVRLIERHAPVALAIEMPVYGRNPQSMLKLGRAQAAAMLAGLNHGVPVAQYTPKEVKKSVTGNGNASKQQIRFMVKSILSIGRSEDLALDASDALAVALCHSNRAAHGHTQQYTGWASFVDANPDRVRE